MERIIIGLCVTVPNFAAIVQTVADIMAIFRSLKVAAAAVLDFQNVEI